MWCGVSPGCLSGLVLGDAPPPCFAQNLHSIGLRFGPDLQSIHSKGLGSDHGWGSDSGALVLLVSHPSMGNELLNVNELPEWPQRELA